MLGWIFAVLVAWILLNTKTNSVAFFHPKCDGNGGGERVLWTMIHALQQKYPQKRILIYCWYHCNTNLSNIEKHFGISLKSANIEFIRLWSYKLLEPDLYPRLTLIGQSTGSLLTAMEAILRSRPTIVFETVGYAFTYPLFRLCGAQVIAYVHYPTISTDMLHTVKNRTSQFNNDQVIAKSKILSQFKLFYYQLFAVIYGLVGTCASLVYVNSSWTKGHIDSLWRGKSHLLYPPCDTKTLSTFDLGNRLNVVVSVAQFRPEKNHILQLDAFALFLSKNKSLDAKLMLIGSVRNENDRAIVQKLEEHVIKLGLQEHVEIVQNASYEQLQHYLSVSLVGIHTMLNEHFGISIIEYMAAGLIPLAHDSGGPKADIVKEELGFLASDKETIAEHLKTIFTMSDRERIEMQDNARESAKRFSAESFEASFLSTLSIN
ncbi:glycosyl transferase family 1 protein [Gorgonomyces haynaldii]|nr:glycosyl transferase family 1 protein [Gorgonomyces haynaldii]